MKCREVHHSLGCVVWLSGWAVWLVWVAPPRQPAEYRTRSAGCRGVVEEPCLAALCVELAAAHFQFEELTLYRFEFFVVGVGAELL